MEMYALLGEYIEVGHEELAKRLIDGWMKDSTRPSSGWGMKMMARRLSSLGKEPGLKLHLVGVTVSMLGDADRKYH